jgi:transcriptional regulator with XRE-family HTH domain
MTPSQEIGAILKKRRNALSLSQSKLAMLAYKEQRHQSLISRIENGSYKEVKFEDVKIILSTLGIDLIKLIKKATQ